MILRVPIIGYVHGDKKPIATITLELHNADANTCRFVDASQSLEESDRRLLAEIAALAASRAFGVPLQRTPKRRRT